MKLFVPYLTIAYVFFSLPGVSVALIGACHAKRLKIKKKVAFAQYYNSYGSYFLNIIRCFCFFIVLFFYVIIIIIINRIKVGRDLGTTYVYLFCFGSF